MAINRDAPVMERPNTDIPAPRPLTAAEQVRSRLIALKIIPDTDSDSPIDEKALRSAPRQDIKELQQELTAASVYVADGSQYYADGRIGPMTLHAVSLAASGDYARRHVAETLRHPVSNSADIMKLQASLNALGFDSGELDGKMGRRTAQALRDFLVDNPDMAQQTNPSFTKTLSTHLGREGIKDVFGHAARPGGDAAIPLANLPNRTSEGHSLLNPEMLAFLEKNPERRPYLDMTLEAARRHGLDPNMFANQIFRESKFDPEAVGPKTRHGRAYGIAQFLPGTAATVGLTRADLTSDDPATVRKVLDGAARHMADLGANYGGQGIAMVAYNGGTRAIDDVRNTINARRARNGEEPQTTVSLNEWNAEMAPRRAQLEARMTRQGRDPSDLSEYTMKERSKWHVQTLDYIRANDSAQWDSARLQRALQQPENSRQVTPPAPEDMPPNTRILVENQPAPGTMGWAFAFAGSPRNDQVRLSETPAEATVRSFLTPQFLRATFAETPGDRVAAAPEHKPKEPAPTAPALT